MKKYLLGFLFLIFISSNHLFAQDIFITGRAIDAVTNTGLPGTYVVNKKSGTGSFADGFGNFSITVHRADTILVAASGFQTQKICFQDSAARNVFNMSVLLYKLKVDLSEVYIMPRRELKEIEKNISLLKTYQEKDYMLSGISSFQSPITYLYQSFSRKEKSKRKVIELRMEDQKRELIKELLFRYSISGVIPIRYSEYDNFIDFCMIPTEFLQSASQYQLIIFFKNKYQAFNSRPVPEQR